MSLISVSTNPFIAGTIALALVSLTLNARSQGTGSLGADGVVPELRNWPAELYTGPMSHLCSAKMKAFAAVLASVSGGSELRPRVRCLSSSLRLPIQAITCAGSRDWRLQNSMGMCRPIYL
jgi:hypothetical protein